jgi:hypothetical protein
LSESQVEPLTPEEFDSELELLGCTACFSPGDDEVIRIHEAALRARIKLLQAALWEIKVSDITAKDAHDIAAKALKDTGYKHEWPLQREK